MSTLDPIEQHKRRAAHESLEHIPSGATVGIGSGSTVAYLIEALATAKERFSALVSSSQQSTKQLHAVGLKATELNHVDRLDVYIDGADELDPHGRLLKGGGGALTSEKILAFAADRFVCIVDERKQVKRLGKDFPVAVEVLPQARSLIARKLVVLGGQPVWREDFTTDHGNHILDVRGLKLLDPIEWEEKIKALPGVVETGIFSKQLPDVTLVGSKKGVQTITY